jgi:hypothetical protein
VAPLQDNAFTHCKSELKYFEAAAVGTVTVASPTHAFAKAIQDGRNGYLAKSFEWTPKLSGALTAIRGSSDNLRVNAREHVKKVYSPQAQQPHIEKILTSFGA